jgi:hypothetical protein
MHRENLALMLALIIGLTGCANQLSRESRAVDLALKTCGNGLSTQSAYVFKAAYEMADKKSGADFGLTMSNSIETQVGVLLKQISSGDASGSAPGVLAEVGRVRECVIQQASALRPVTRMELIEQCRQVLQDRVSPKGSTRYAVIRNWNPILKDKEYKVDIPIMSAFVDTGGSSSSSVKVKCDISGGVLRDVAVIDSIED